MVRGEKVEPFPWPGAMRIDMALRSGVLPAAGGLDDQETVFLDELGLVLNAIGEVESARAADARDKQREGGDGA
jgi:hypothetical protein